MLQALPPARISPEPEHFHQQVESERKQPRTQQNANRKSGCTHHLHAKILLEAGVDVNLAAAAGTTPWLASLYKWDPLGKEFVGGTNAPVLAGSSARFGADLAMARFLLDHGAHMKVTDGAGYTPLHGAALAVATITTAGRDHSAWRNGRAAKTNLPGTDKPAPPNPQRTKLW